MGKAGGWGLTRMAYSGDALRPYRWVHFWRSWDHVRKVTLRNAVFEDFRFSKIFDKYIIYLSTLPRLWSGYLLPRLMPDQHILNNDELKISKQDTRIHDTYTYTQENVENIVLVLELKCCSFQSNIGESEDIRYRHILSLSQFIKTNNTASHSRWNRTTTLLSV